MQPLIEHKSALQWTVFITGWSNVDTIYVQVFKRQRNLHHIGNTHRNHTAATTKAFAKAFGRARQHCNDTFLLRSGLRKKKTSKKLCMQSCASNWGHTQKKYWQSPRWFNVTSGGSRSDEVKCDSHPFHALSQGGYAKEGNNIWVDTRSSFKSQFYARQTDRWQHPYRCSEPIWLNHRRRRNVVFVPASSCCRLSRSLQWRCRLLLFKNTTTAAEIRRLLSHLHPNIHERTGAAAIRRHRTWLCSTVRWHWRR